MKDAQRVTFDGTDISVWELKREIMTIMKLGDGKDFDLALYKDNTDEGKHLEIFHGLIVTDMLTCHQSTPKTQNEYLSHLLSSRDGYPPRSPGEVRPTNMSTESRRLRLDR